MEVAGIKGCNDVMNFNVDNTSIAVIINTV
jgi:hypothetical protein